MTRSIRLVAALAAASAVLAAPLFAVAGVPTAAAAEDTPEQTAPAWGPCEAGIDHEYQCATVAVPLDYADPTGTTIPIALVRYPAEPARREGAVLFNPGGPGGSGFGWIAKGGERIDEALGLERRFDIVGFDPRGVGHSGELRCLTDEELDSIFYTGIATGDGATGSASAGLRSAPADAFTDRCHERYGETLRHYSTEYTARDMDAIRAAMGDEQISYIGVSYGTYLGAVYATLFPERVRAMVLDSAFDPAGDTPEQGWLTQPAGFEHAFRNWGAWCQSDPTCAFHAPDVGARWDALMTRLAADPIVTADGRRVDAELVLDVTKSSMYGELDWPVLARALAAAEAGDGEVMLAMADMSNGRADDGSYASGLEAGLVIRCASGIDQQPVADPAALLTQLRQVAPRMTQFYEPSWFRDDGLCRNLVGSDVVPPAPAYSGTAPVLVVGGLNDPATPFRWANELVARMGPNAALATYSGEGHGYVLSSTCVAGLEGAVIADLTLPAPNTACSPDPAIARPAVFDQLPRLAGVGELVTDPAVAPALGLHPSRWFAEVRYLEGPDRDVTARFIAALVKRGHRVVETTSPDPGMTRIDLVAPDGGEVLIEVIAPAAVEAAESLDVVEELTPAGAGYVVVAARPTDK